MTTEQAARGLLESMESLYQNDFGGYQCNRDEATDISYAMNQLEEALAQQEQDCVGWFGYDTGLRLWFEANKGDDGAIPLYKEIYKQEPVKEEFSEEWLNRVLDAAMAQHEDEDEDELQRQWIGLTDEEIEQLSIDAGIITWVKRVYDDVDKKFYDLPLGEGMEGDGISLKQFASLISKNLKEKNT
jgi:hypothetical protein